ncbi:uncharacterized protein LOC129290234 isoform X2 [Prosopis cineraria]|uniref:uncharacterized protein LOC129290234 isoform X2 n=1 Tax=Prosopis cineraria TaxID=364024 RepID=UPI00240ED2D4|nr:uncharacterized protein LOC129290234 isoform X2 [Prosopis cineraria]
MESLYDLYKRSSASVVKDGYIRKEDLHFALCRKGNKRNLFVDRLKVMVLAILTESNMKLSNDVVEIIVDKTLKMMGNLIQSNGNNMWKINHHY